MINKISINELMKMYNEDINKGVIRENGFEEFLSNYITQNGDVVRDYVDSEALRSFYKRMDASITKRYKLKGVETLQCNSAIDLLRYSECRILQLEKMEV